MKTRILLAVLVVVAGFMGCTKEAPPSIFVPNIGSAPQPVITSVTPASGGLAGITTITITGQNFSAVPAENIVLFDASVATILQNSTTQLVVKAPKLVKDSIKIKISVQQALLFSEPKYYNLASATIEFGSFAPNEKPYGAECDTAGNVYVSITTNNLQDKVLKFTPTGTRSPYSPAFSAGVANWRSMKFGWGGAMYCTAGRPFLFSIPAGGGTSKIWLSGHGLGIMNDLDFDQLGNLWAAGAGIYRLRRDSTVTAYPFVGTIRAVRVFQGYLYVGGLRDSLEQVWRFPISAGGDLGAEESYFNLSSIYGPNSYGVQALTFSSDGDLYVGTDGPDGIFLVHADKTSEPLYPGVLSPTASSFAWGAGPSLFFSRTSASLTQTLVKLNTQKTSAPYYGRLLP